MRVFNGVDELRAAAGSQLGVSDWITIDQSQVDTFADATLSLLSHLVSQTFRIDGTKMGVNYGLNRVRFTSPVPVGSKVRGNVELVDVTDIEGGVQMTTKVTVEIEGSERPALVAEWLTRRYV